MLKSIGFCPKFRRSNTFSNIFLRIECVFSGTWTHETWKYNCMSWAEATHVRGYTPLQHPVLKRWHFCCVFLPSELQKIVWFCFTAVSIISSSGIPVRLYCHWMNSFAEWILVKTCDSDWWDWPAYFFLQDRAAVSTWEIVEGGQTEKQTEKKSWSFILGLVFYFSFFGNCCKY